ncbi:MAG: hypothetical protein Q8L55_13925 [Phycisphaerales bacterium]|nr:hypothetical protein [Phycisphaerales bacterium]
MLALTLQSATDHLARHGVVRDGHSWLTSAPSAPVATMERLQVPRLVPCARVIAGHLNAEGGNPVVLLIDERGIWPSSEDWLPPTLIRRHGGLGEAACDFDGFPGMLLAGHERAELVSLLACCLSGGLGFMAAGHSGIGGVGAAVRINHDGNGWVAGSDAAAAERSARFLADAAG